MKQYNWEQDQIAHMKVNLNIEYMILVIHISYMNSKNNKLKVSNTFLL